MADDMKVHHRLTIETDMFAGSFGIPGRAVRRSRSEGDLSIVATSPRTHRKDVAAVAVATLYVPPLNLHEAGTADHSEPILPGISVVRSRSPSPTAASSEASGPDDDRGSPLLSGERRATPLRHEIPSDVLEDALRGNPPIEPPIEEARGGSLSRSDVKKNVIGRLFDSVGGAMSFAQSRLIEWWHAFTTWCSGWIH